MKNILRIQAMVIALSVLVWPAFAQQPVLRGGLSNCSVSVADLQAGATTTYTVSFTPDETLDPSALVSDQMAIATTAGGPDFSGAVVDSVTGGTISLATQGTTNATSVAITINTGEATSADTVTFVLSNVINPGAAGAGSGYEIRGVDFEGFPNPNPAPTVSICPVSGSIYTPSNDPVVVNPIADQVLNQSDGAVDLVDDLDTVFADADGVLTFSVSGNTDATVATASIDANDTLTITPQGSGTTTFTIEASSGGASITNSFDVRVIGQLGNVTITPQDLDTGATTSYIISFTPSNIFEGGYSMGINSGVSGPDYTNATLQSISGGTLTAEINGSPTNQGIGLNITGGTASSSDTITIQLDNVVNPGAAGQGPDYTITVLDFLPVLVVVDTATVAGNVYESVGAPTVLQQIPIQNLDEANGPGVVVADLNTIFTDGDGDPLTFTVEAGNDANTATASINGDELTVTPTGPGTTTITVKASDLPAGGEGEVTTSFDVNVVGLMDNASWTPITVDTDNITIYTFTFDPSSTLETGQRIIINNAAAGGPDYTNAALNFIQGGSLTAVIDSQDVDTIVAEITGGTAGVGDTVTLEFGNIVNPAVGGLGPDYELRLFRLFPPSGDVERITLSGTVFNDVGMPTVTTPIEDQELNEIDGAEEIIADLNTVFTDGNGQTLVFTVESGNDAMVATASISNNALTVTPVGSGTTTITVQASDLAAGGTGTVTDSFEVRVIGELDNVNIIPASQGISADTVYQLAFTPAGDIAMGDVIRVSTTAGGPDFSAASLENFSGGTLAAALMAQSPTTIDIEIMSGLATSANTISFEFNPVTNPTLEGIGPGYLVEIIDAAVVQDFATAPGTDFIDTDIIFRDGFDVAATRNQLAKAFVADVPYFGEAATQRPFYDNDSQHYLFAGAYLSRDLNDGEMRSQAEVRHWLRSVLVAVSPQGDWDSDGLLNAEDTRPFGLK
ncbi:beta strand repeat-containing protein [Marinicella sp. W31]|uniref:beta strand repeat-containing protein n=1 Tax=Marinicella sp. W31 TaxID=3023713 RepID=UPI00375714C7